jgi:hypothetical protein
MKKYRAQQVCKANISQKFEKIYRAKPVTADKNRALSKSPPPPPLSTKGCTVFCSLSLAQLCSNPKNYKYCWSNMIGNEVDADMQ